MSAAMPATMAQLSGADHTAVFTLLPLTPRGHSGVRSLLQRCCVERFDKNTPNESRDGSGQPDRIERVSQLR